VDPAVNGRSSKVSCEAWTSEGSLIFETLDKLTLYGDVISNSSNNTLLPQLRANILLLGLAGSGKTSIVNALSQGAQHELVPTVGFNMERMDFDRCRLIVTDMSGQTKYQPLWEVHFQDAQASAG
jgi:GTPase SAR1 family protein